MTSIQKVTKALKWGVFCDKRPNLGDELVREFYVNLTSSALTEVSIQGIKVRLSSSSINEFYDLPDFEDNEYSFVMENIEAEKLQEVLQELTIPGSKWTVSKHRTHTCYREYLTPLAKVWFYFVLFSLMPISHGTAILVKQMILLYSIMTPKTINVGKSS
ncbi:hypothetical protein J1N35_011086 [Gossypium stocksii]|uniref:Putative plant transposon protein domain-containing protein n=1 Tax=Gossypium stocksii TaxID=47602 RepID=A0A9D3W2V3_9ROSI|nr:hypothetical protein J1N35_011086 [Gossypium stocksii]